MTVSIDERMVRNLDLYDQLRECKSKEIFKD